MCNDCLVCLFLWKIFHSGSKFSFKETYCVLSCVIIFHLICVISVILILIEILFFLEFNSFFGNNSSFLTFKKKEMNDNFDFMVKITRTRIKPKKNELKKKKNLKMKEIKEKKRKEK